MPEISNTWLLIVGAIITLVLAPIGYYFGYYVLGPLIGKLFPAIIKEHTLPQLSYKEKMTSLTRSLIEASAEVDRVLKEIAEIGNQRQGDIAKLELQLQNLTDHEKQLQEKVNALEKVPLPAIEHFVKAIESGEKRSALRDYILFGLGVIVSTVIAIVLKLLFGI